MSRYSASDSTSLTVLRLLTARDAGILITILERNVSTGIVSEPTVPSADT